MAECLADAVGGALEAGLGRVDQVGGHAEDDHRALEAQGLRGLHRRPGRHGQLREDLGPGDDHVVELDLPAGRRRRVGRGRCGRFRVRDRFRVPTRAPARPCAARRARAGPRRTRRPGPSSRPEPVPTRGPARRPARRTARCVRSAWPGAAGPPPPGPPDAPRSSRSMRSMSIWSGGPASRRLSRTRATSSTSRGSAASVPRMSTTAWPMRLEHAHQRGVAQRLAQLAQTLLVLDRGVDVDATAARSQQERVACAARSRSSATRRGS